MCNNVQYLECLNLNHAQQQSALTTGCKQMVSKCLNTGIVPHQLAEDVLRLLH